MTTKESPALLAGGDRATSKVQRSIHSTEGCESVARWARLERPTRPVQRGKSTDFAEINQAALAAFPAVLAHILPGSKCVGAEIVALNPRRTDRHLGSFKINRYNGRWADFATGDRGGDPISLVAFLARVSQVDAARLLGRMLGLEVGGRRP
jgi:hypothetical protein